MSNNDSFLSRWSRLKRTTETKAAPPPAPEDSPPPEAAPDVPSPPPLLSEEELAALPRIEDLTLGSDIRAFMRPGVPAALRNAALRRMWSITPAIRDYRDPAVDYAWDWNTPGGVPGDGCAPTAERAAELLRKIVEPRAPKPQETAPAPDDQTAEVAEPKADEPRRDSRAAPPAEAPQTPEVSHPEKSLDLKDKADSPAPRKRHGGALPS